MQQHARSRFQTAFVSGLAIGLARRQSPVIVFGNARSSESVIDPDGAVLVRGPRWTPTTCVPTSGPSSDRSTSARDTDAVPTPEERTA